MYRKWALEISLFHLLLGFVAGSAWHRMATQIEARWHIVMSSASCTWDHGVPGLNISDSLDKKENRLRESVAVILREFEWQLTHRSDTWLMYTLIQQYEPLCIACHHSQWVQIGGGWATQRGRQSPTLRSPGGSRYSKRWSKKVFK